MCPEVNHPQFKLMVRALLSAGYTADDAESVAHLMWDRNGANFMDKAPNGKDSTVYKHMLQFYGSDYTAALSKMRTLTQEFKTYYKGEYDANNEPVVEQGKVVDAGLGRSYRLVSPDMMSMRNYNIQRNQREAGKSRLEAPSEFLARVRTFGDNMVATNDALRVQELIDQYNMARRSMGYGPAFKLVRTMEGWQIQETQGEAFFSLDDPAWLENAFGNMSDYIKGYIHQLKMNLLKSPKDKVYLEAEIKRMEEALRVAERQFDYDAMYDIANQEMDKVDVVLREEPSLHQLHNALVSVSTWERMMEVLVPLEEVDTSLGAEVEVITTRATKLKQRIAGKVYQELVKLGNTELDQTIQEEDFRKIVETSMLNANFRDLSTNTNKSVQLLDKILKDAVRQGQSEHFKYLQELGKQIKVIKKSSLWKKEKFDPILQFNKDGEWTGGHINTYSHEWFENLRKLRDAAIDSTNPREASDKWKTYWAFKNENEVVLDTRILFEDLGNGEMRVKDDTSAKRLRAEVVRQAGEDHAKYVLEMAEERYQKYLKEKEAYIERLKVDYELQDPAAFDRAVDQWISDNSPDNYISRRLDRKFKKTDNKSTAWKYFVSIPKSIDSNGKRTAWYDERFTRLMEDPAYEEYKQFYNFMRASMKKFLEMVPEHYVANLNANFLPEVGMSFVEKLGSKNALRVLKQMPRDEYASLFENSIAVMTSAVNPMTDKPFNNIPLGFLKTGTVTEDRTKDVAVMLQMFSGMAINYKHLSDIEDAVLLLQGVINNAKEVKRNSKGGIIVNMANRVATFGSHTSHTNETVNYAVDAILYNRKRESEGRVFVPSDLTPEQEERRKEIAKELADLEDNLSSGDIEYEEYNSKLRALSVELQEITGKDFVGSKAFDKILIATQIKGMAFNPFAASANLGFGLMSNFVHAAGDEDFNTGQLVKAIRLMMHNILRAWSGKKLGGRIGRKISNVMGVYNVLFEVNEAKYGKQKFTEKTRRSGKNIYFMQTMTEFVVQGVTTIATMLNTTVEGSDGNTYNLWDITKEDGTIDRDKVSAETAESLESGRAFRKNQNKIIQVNKKIHGNYDISASPMKIKKTALGRGMMQFRTWIPEGVANRFENERYDEMLGRKVKGRWRSYGSLYNHYGGVMGTPKALLEILKGIVKLVSFGRAFPKAFDGLSAVDKANMQRNIMELAFAAIFILMASMLGGDDDDDDLTWKRRLLNVFMNMTNRIESDIYFYISPSTFEEITRNPLPVFKTISDSYEAIEAVAKLPFYEDVDGEYLLRKSAKALPYVNLVPKWYGYSGRVY